MKPTICTSLLLASVTALTFVARGNQVSPGPIPRGSSAYIETMDGFGPELQEALLNNGVPLVIVSNKDNADFEIIGGIRDVTEQPMNGLTSSRQQQGDAQPLRARLITVTIVNLKTKSVAWGYGVTGVPDLAGAADSFAKRLKGEMKQRHQKH